MAVKCNANYIAWFVFKWPLEPTMRIKGSNTVVCHISLTIQQSMVKFTPLIYSMKINQIVKFDLICIMGAMVTVKSLLTVNGFQ